ncbi:hypothetical protein EMIHUDRAFT_219308 [Emiliania huxleyi CCMP1516]|uniref:Uncharacterized protein n=2 Tax=Emiliania huxleyi TaxID=2903 RepID=A0A0D3I577_EMIH1|nr:hypothetical protein EMIHUDRAFT_219308 [Emiliania huxleyi CCMP1516]EOD06412.1 hypothetical protein EMIHUDRAFT_219308 [Emiliania huxleyi CCMP1516]|eukprot:XP_005758841.1 hypothetical protein EMIHUDRAFT_219308 [Emiliania huxleyi CCMP1516]
MTAARLLRSCVGTLVTFVLAPVFCLILLPFYVLVFSPWIALGLCSSDAAVGVPPALLAWRRLPYLIPMVLFVDLPIAIFFLATGMIEGLFLRNSLTLAVYSLFRRASQLPNREPTLPDAEAGLRARERPRSNTIDGARYHGHDSIWAALEGDGDKVQPGDVRLVSLNWLMELAERGDVLPRRQDLPEEAFLSSAQLRRIEQGARRGFDLASMEEALERFTKEPTLSSTLGWLASFFGRKRNPDGLLPIISVSYCWLEAAHPDREGRQLQLLCRKLRGLYGGRGLLGACRDYGFSDMGVFLDWSSGYQKDPALWREWMSAAYEAMPEGALYVSSDSALARMAGGERMVAERRAYEASRSVEQKAAFGRMLENTMDLWYAHASVTVVLLTQLPDELPAGFDRSRTYDTRGWTTFERCSAELGAKPASLGFAKWKLVIDVASDDGGAQRRLPATPERMATLLAACRFTNGADSAAVQALYEKTAKAVLGTVEKLYYNGLPLVRGDAWTSPALLAEALNHCESLRSLVLLGTRLDDEGVAELAAGLEDGALPALETLFLNASRFGARGVGALCGVFHRGVAPTLQTLDVGQTPIGDEGAVAIAAALSTGKPSHGLKLDMCDVGDEGAMALAAALPAAGQGCRVNAMFNRIGLAGQAALLDALEAKHGPQPGHGIAVQQMNLLPWSCPLIRAFGRGFRRVLESGRVTIYG